MSEEGDVNSHDVGDPTYGVIFAIMALAFGIVAKKYLKFTRLPYTALLLIIGCVFEYVNVKDASLFGMVGESANKWAGINAHLILYGFLPALIFGSAFHVDYHIFRHLFSQIILLASFGVGLATVITAGFAKYAFDYDWDWNTCFMFGAMMSATDPVAVVALLQELGAPQRLSILIEGESLLNDGTAMVIWLVFRDAMVGEGMGVVEAIIFGGRLSFGAVLLGIVGGVIAVWLLGQVIQDTAIEITITLVAAYGLFIFGEVSFLEVSGVLTCVTLGLIMSSDGKTRITSHEAMHSFWSMMDYIANTLIFVLAGVVVSSHVFDDDSNIKLHDWLLMLALYLALNIIRGIVVLIQYPILKRTGYGFGPREACVLVHGGLRGAVGLALGLMIYEDSRIEEETREKVIFMMSGIATLTLLVNGSTAGSVVNMLGLSKSSCESKRVFDNSSNILEKKLEKAVDQLKHSEFYRLTDWKMVWDYLPAFSDQVLKKREDKHLNDAEKDKHLHKVVNMAQQKFRKDSFRLSRTQSVLMRKKTKVIGEARRRFLNLVKSQYWHQFESGFVDGQAVSVLTEAADQAVDEHGTALKEWSCLAKVLRIPRALVFLQNQPLVGCFFKRMLRSHLGFAYDVAESFIAAHLIVQGQFQDLVELNIGSDVMKESIENVGKARKFMASLHSDFPEICQIIQTRHAIRSLLHHYKKQAHKLMEHGDLDGPEYDSIQQGIVVCQKRLKQHPPVMALKNDEELLKRSKLLEGVTNEGVIQCLCNNALEKFFDADKYIFKAGQNADGIHLITRGTVIVYRKVTNGDGEVNEEEVDRVCRGSIIGSSPTLAGTHHQFTCKAESVVRSTFIPRDVILNAIRRDSSEYVCGRAEFDQLTVGPLAKNMCRLAMIAIVESQPTAILGNKSPKDIRMVSEIARVVAPKADVPTPLLGCVILCNGSVSMTDSLEDFEFETSVAKKVNVEAQSGEPVLDAPCVLGLANGEPLTFSKDALLLVVSHHALSDKFNPATAVAKATAEGAKKKAYTRWPSRRKIKSMIGGEFGDCVNVPRQSSYVDTNEGIHTSRWHSAMNIMKTKGFLNRSSGQGSTLELIRSMSADLPLVEADEQDVLDLDNVSSVEPVSIVPDDSSDSDLPMTGTHSPYHSGSDASDGEDNAFNTGYTSSSNQEIVINIV